jgi:hypothetical protein
MLQLFCPANGRAALPPATPKTVIGLPPPKDPIFPVILGPRPPQKTAPSPLLMPNHLDEEGEIIPSTVSALVVAPLGRKLDPRTPIFRSRADKDAFQATLPSAIQLQLSQKFGKDNLKQCFYLQKSGTQALHLLYSSGYLSNYTKNKLERAFAPARQYRRLVKLYQNVDFSSLQGFQKDWEKQTELSLVQRDLTTACLIYFNLSLPAMVRWIGGPHVAAHRDNDAIFARLKETCDEQNLNDLVRVFTQGSPTLVNADCTQENYRAYRDYGNHSTIADNQAMVDKTLLKEVSRGCAMMLDPDIMDFIENIKTTPHGILYLEHPYKNPRVVCDATCRPEYWCMAINDWTSKDNEPKLIFAGAFVANLTWIWNLRITYPYQDIYVCDDDVTNAFKQAKYPPNLAGMHCKIINGILYVDTAQTFGDNTSPANWEPIAICRSQHARALWHRHDTIARAVPLLPKIEHQEPATKEEVSRFAKANRDSQNTGVLDADGKRQAPPYRHHVDDNLYAEVAQFLERTVCASALALYEILGFPDGRQVGALSMEKLDTMYRPERTAVGYHVNTRDMTVCLLQYKRDQSAEVIEPWLTGSTFTLLDGAELCGKLENASTCCRWIRPFFFSVQNTIRAALNEKWKKVQGYYIRQGIEKVKAKYRLPKNLERRLKPLIARDKALLLWHSKAKFDTPRQVQQDLAQLQTWLRDPAIKWEKSIAHWIQRDPTFVSAGDASHEAGGAIMEQLRFWFDVQWSPRVRKGCKLAPTDPEFVHINSLEFIVVLIQLAATIVADESGYATAICGDSVPEIPLLQVWTDNAASKSWANRVTTSAPAAQPLLGILSSLLRRNNLGFETEHIAGEDNDGPDFISRPSRANEPALSHFHRAQQIFANEKRLRSFSYFRLSPELASLLESTLFSGQWAAPPSLPKNLGHFEHTVCTTSLFVSI